MKGLETLVITKDGNLRTEINVFKCVYDAEVVKNLIMQRCQILKGELPYNIVMGIGLKSNKDALDLDISSIILNTKGVKEIKSFESTLVDKKYNANIIVITNKDELIEVNL